MDDYWNEPQFFLILIMVILVANGLWIMYLLMRQIFVIYQADQVPEPLRPYLSNELFQRMRLYKVHTSWLLVINTLIVVVICGCIELYFGFYAFLWDVVDRCAFRKWMKHEICMSIVYTIFLAIYITIKSLPARLYECCCIVPLVPYPNYSWIQRLIGTLLHFAISLLVLTAGVSIIVSMVMAFHEWAFLGLYLLVILVLLSIMLLLPCCIDPFVGKRVQLENEALKSGLRELTGRVGFPMRQVYVIHIRDPKAGSNAFFFGSCCLKRIVIYDTLLRYRGKASGEHLAPEDRDKGLTNEMVLAVVAHELGHWKKGHFYKSFIMFVHLGIVFALLCLCHSHGPIYMAVGFEKGLEPIIVGIIIIVSFVLTPYLTLSNFAMLSMTRRFEYQADRFAYQLGYGPYLKQALLKLYADNLAFPLWDDTFSKWHHSHPTIMQRLQHLDDLQGTRS